MAKSSKSLILPIDPIIRLEEVINKSWQILFSQITSKRLSINKESSLQLHLSKIILDLGILYCVLPGEQFEIELVANRGNMRIDLICKLGTASAAIELKCFRKASNRAKDLDSYDALKDVQRLQHLEEFDLKKFICLTDNDYYPYTEQTGLGKNVSLKNGKTYPADIDIVPGWANKWKVKRDRPLRFKKSFSCNWDSDSGWHSLFIDAESAG
ncbi:MAG: hypothetical protein EP332_04620 [Bacteroidetes bacterium]|nr:MAG: hypothetical protein EP332_04620 [Bacteroidota bacterium]